MANEISNYIKREKCRKEETKKAIAEMRAALPTYSLEEIRQYKLPYDEALLINLNEKGFASSSEFLKQLMEFEHNMREVALPTSAIWTRPSLAGSKNELKYLSDMLVESETYFYQDNHAKECDVLLKAAIRFAFCNEEWWWWLGEQLLIQAVTITSKYPSLGGKYEALSRYAYGKFLIDNLRTYEPALEEFKIVGHLSRGKDWTTKTIFPSEERVRLSMRTSYYLYLCLIREAKSMLQFRAEGKIDYATTAQMAAKARKRAAEACYHEGETEALLLMGMCYLNMNANREAISSYNKAVFIQQKLNSDEGMCEARIHLAKAYLINGNADLSLKTLMKLKEVAENQNMPFYLAHAYKQLGEYFLNNGQSSKATPLLNEALTIFHESNNVKDSREVRVLEAISSGLEMFPRYLKLLTKTEKKDENGADNLKKLVAWKDSREIFWDDTIPHLTVSEIIRKQCDDHKQDEVIVNEEDSIIGDESFSALQATLEKSTKKRPKLNRGYLQKIDVAGSVVNIHLGMHKFKEDSDSD